MSSPPPLTLVQVTCFVTVAETASFAETGRHLGMTTSGVSKTIARLETVRGIRLFNRSTHAVSLTPEGERLLPLAQAALGRMAEVDRAMSAAAEGGTGGRVRLSAPTAFVRACLAPLLPLFRAGHPNVVLDLRGNDAMVDLAVGGIDLALRTGRIRGIPGHRIQHLLTFPWVTCASPDYVRRKGEPSDPADLARHDLIGFRNQRTGIVDPWRYRQRVRDESEDLRLVPNPAFVLDDANASAAAAVAGSGILWAPQWLVAAALRSGTLVPLLAGWAGEAMRMSIVRRDGPAPERNDQVIAFLRAHRTSFGANDPEQRSLTGGGDAIRRRSAATGSRSG